MSAVADAKIGVVMSVLLNSENQIRQRWSHTEDCNTSLQACSHYTKLLKALLLIFLTISHRERASYAVG